MSEHLHEFGNVFGVCRDPDHRVGPQAHWMRQQSQMLHMDMANSLPMDKSFVTSLSLETTYSKPHKRAFAITTNLSAHTPSIVLDDSHDDHQDASLMYTESQLSLNPFQPTDNAKTIKGLGWGALSVFCTGLMLI